MSETKTTRKRRTDRNHIVYLLTCDVTGDTYIGITVCRGRALQKSLDTRWKGHLYHAIVENRDLMLAATIRRNGAEAFSKEIIEVVRGKKAAHARETVLIKQLRPTLNTKSAR